MQLKVLLGMSWALGPSYCPHMSALCRSPPSLFLKDAPILEISLTLPYYSGYLPRSILPLKQVKRFDAWRLDLVDQFSEIYSIHQLGIISTSWPMNRHHTIFTICITSHKTWLQYHTNLSHNFCVVQLLHCMTCASHNSSVARLLRSNTTSMSHLFYYSKNSSVLICFVLSDSKESVAAQ